MHMSRTTFVGVVDDGQFRMPRTMHIAYCGEKTASAVTTEEGVTCDECIQAMCWEEIDRRNCETHLGG